MTTMIRNDWIRDSKGEWIFDRDVHAVRRARHPRSRGPISRLRFGVGRAVGWLDYENHKYDLPEPMYALQVDGVAI